MEGIENELMGFCTWDDLSVHEKAEYIIAKRDKKLDREFFGYGNQIERIKKNLIDSQ